MTNSVNWVKYQIRSKYHQIKRRWTFRNLLKCNVKKQTRGLEG